MATIAPEEVEILTPGGMGATLSPASVIFLTTMPAKGARMVVKSEVGLLHLQVRLVLLDGRLRQRHLGLSSVEGILRRYPVAM